MIATEVEVDRLVGDVRADPGRRAELVALLREDHPAHAGKGSGATARVRAWVLAAFADVGMPDAALPHVVEELETGVEPELVAAAARAAGGDRAVRPELAGPLVAALWNMAGRDDAVSFDSMWPSWPAREPTTALLEVIATLRAMGSIPAVRDALTEFAAARGALLSGRVTAALAEPTVPAPACCAGSSVRPASGTGPAARVPAGIVVEDQHGERLDLGRFLGQAPTLLAFFYTRCDNPQKCSLTVTSLGAVARDLAERARLGAVQVAAITYDPGYDTAARLLRYGRDRAVPFGPAVRMFRVTAGHDDLRETLALRVGYSASVVSRHAVELFLLDTAGQVTRSWVRQRIVATDVAGSL